MARKSITVSTADYEANHGAKPRGEGCWAFIMHLAGGRPSELWFATPDLRFGEAKKEALAWGRMRDAAWIEVGS